MAYGLRNLSDPAAALGELRRLLKPGAKAAVLDFNRPDPAMAGTERLARFQRFYLRQLVVPTAERFGVRENYAYLEASLERFATAAQQEQLAQQAGFSQVQHRPLAGGLMGLLELVA